LTPETDEFQALTLLHTKEFSQTLDFDVVFDYEW